MKYPNLWTVESLMQSVRSVSVCRDGDNWMPGRPLGYPSFISRCKCAWAVFTGKADAVIWPGDQ